ncbi:hypothetical protein BATDEDRAFT_33779 [Batrachochytrium dendrobatidis JAM81]|uniref:4-coumarate-CoA ligase n=2 Tax=Batrachochytrium dendrobatidis TaxID=109871 RepID=F4PCR2_BATDJ|nr:uncharacterized protein BATDEDRAFT_33779 [Batrachochytrium dendrobatidis JAM81]EGF76873.1 hypothetical protein BATDEDRAFT_33779 [Batrachochytrium dendrobatidis JAM81]OAJ44947.1 hypothetical protein BDEG_28125 [Batrachochytrium dendrobatidis JEL423]|eukprot:XP_006682438.1 hypothetical protein BATDEDRAFT_33779 [Batrachochytrium dendrobatidis JAM81]
MIYTSPYPDLYIPEQDVPSFIFGSKGFQSNPNKPALIDGPTGKVITFRDLEKSSASFAAGLHHQLGFKKRDVVALYTPNDINYSTVMYGTLMAGGSVSGINPAYTVDELAYQLHDSGASVLIVGHEQIANAKAAAKVVGLPLNRIFVFASKSINGIHSFTSLLSSKLGPVVKFTKNELANEAAYLCYSSGTTGRSKGVITTHRNMVANVLQTNVFEVNDRLPDEIWMGVLPFFHIYGLNISLHQAAFGGNTMVVVPKFDFVQFLEFIQRYQITVLHVVPPIVLAMAKHPIVDKFDLSSVRRATSGAAPLGSELAQAFSKRLKIPAVQGYGLTETTPVTHMCPSSRIVDGSIGFLVPNMQARLIDPDTGKDAMTNQPGELWLRGPNVMKGYINNPSATKDSIDQEGYFHTGDVAVVGPTGHFFIVDRLKELIKYKGFQVPPAELEAKLITHPSIADAAVISLADKEAGELPLAYVVLQPGKKLTEKEVQEFIAGQVAYYKQLRGGVVFVDAIPKAASGKILRRILRAMDKERVSKKIPDPKL